MNNEEIVNRIKYLIRERMLTQSKFARLISMDVSNLSKHLNGKLSISESLINRIVVNLGVSKEWLINGTDVPYPKIKTPRHVTVAKQLDVINGGNTPVYDVDVTAGKLSRASMFANDNIIGMMNIPSIPSDCRIVRVSGDSMNPVIHSGDLLAVRLVENDNVIFWGQIYVVLLDDYRMVKYVRRHSDPDKVILKSENPNYDDIEVSRKDIREMMFVHNIIHIDTRM